MIEIMSGLIDLLLALPTSERTFAPDEFVFHQGDEVRAVYLVREGAVNLICDAVAVAPTVTRSVRKSAVRARLARNRAFAEAWLAHLAREVQAARTRAEILSLRTVAERLDAWVAARGTFPAKGEWKTLAAEIGTSPEALYRELAKRR
jgi:CRP/FNR family transcriptional regulator, dissimilatory nitrate respiration regulator